MEGETFYQVLKSPFEHQQVYGSDDKTWTEVRGQYSVRTETGATFDYEEVIQTSKAHEDTELSMTTVAKGISITASQIDGKNEGVVERSNLAGKCLIEYPQEDGKVSLASSLVITQESDGMTLYAITKKNGEVQVADHERIAERKMNKIVLPIPKGTRVSYGVRSRIVVDGDFLLESDSSPEEVEMTEVRHAIIDYKRLNPKKFK
jgi:hypothetical protein